MRKSLVIAFALSLAPCLAQAQTVFTAVLSGGQETPVNGSANSGFGTFYFDPVSKNLTYDVTISGLTGSLTGSHIHGPGAPGVSAGILSFITGGPTHWAGTIGPLSAQEETELKSGLDYVNIHSSTFPAGEIRGQITPSLNVFAAVLNGNKEVPPVPTAGSGTATVVINPNKTVTYNVIFSGLNGPATAAHVHDGAVGVSGGVLFALTQTGPNSFAGTSGAQSDLTLAKIRSGRTYVNVHTTVFTGGEIRGQVVAAFTPYETGCNLGGNGTLSGSGVPAPGQPITIDVSGAVGSQPGVLFIGFAGKKLPFGFDCDLLIQPPVFSIALVMPPSGSFSLPATLPPSTPVPADVHLQYFGGAPSENGGFFTTNGLVMHVAN